MASTNASANKIRGLRNFISEIRAAKTKEEERARVDEELRKISSKFGGAGGARSSSRLSVYDRKKYVWKLLYIHVLGYDVPFGHAQAVDLLPSRGFAEKQVGYLACSCLLASPSQAPLLHACAPFVRADLAGEDEGPQCLALAFAANMADPALACELAPEVLRLLASPTARPVVRKKAALCLLRLIRKSPPDRPLVTAEQASPLCAALLEERELGAVLCGTALLSGMVARGGTCAGFEMCAPRLLAALQRCVHLHEVSADYTYYGIASPWLQVRLLRALGLFPPPDGAGAARALRETLSALITAHGEAGAAAHAAAERAAAQAAAAGQAPPRGSVNQNKINAQHAILLEAIALTVAVCSASGGAAVAAAAASAANATASASSSSFSGGGAAAAAIVPPLLTGPPLPGQPPEDVTAHDPQLFAAAVGCLGRMLSYREANARYLALEALARLSLAAPEVAAAAAAARSGPRHVAAVLAHLRDPDVGVRRRALDLLLASADAETGPAVVEELCRYLPAAEAALRERTALAAAVLAERFAPSAEWYAGAALSLLERGAEYCPDEVWQRCVQVLEAGDGGGGGAAAKAQAARAACAALARWPSAAAAAAGAEGVAAPAPAALLCGAACLLGEYGRLIVAPGALATFGRESERQAAARAKAAAALAGGGTGSSGAGGGGAAVTIATPAAAPPSAFVCASDDPSNPAPTFGAGSADLCPLAGSKEWWRFSEQWRLLAARLPQAPPDARGMVLTAGLKLVLAAEQGAAALEAQAAAAEARRGAAAAASAGPTGGGMTPAALQQRAAVAAAAAAALRAEAGALRGEVERALERHSSAADGADPDLQSRAAEYRSVLRLPPAQAAQRRVRLVARWEAATAAGGGGGGGESGSGGGGGGGVPATQAEGPVVLLRRLAAADGTDADIEGREDAELQAGGLALGALTGPAAPGAAPATPTAAAATAAAAAAAAGGAAGGTAAAVAAIAAATATAGTLEVSYASPSAAAHEEGGAGAESEANGGPSSSAPPAHTAAAEAAAATATATDGEASHPGSPRPKIKAPPPASAPAPALASSPSAGSAAAAGGGAGGSSQPASPSKASAAASKAAGTTAPADLMDLLSGEPLLSAAGDASAGGTGLLAGSGGGGAGACDSSSSAPVAGGGGGSGSSAAAPAAPAAPAKPADPLEALFGDWTLGPSSSSTAPAATTAPVAPALAPAAPLAPTAAAAFAGGGAAAATLATAAAAATAAAPAETPRTAAARSLNPFADDAEEPAAAPAAAHAAPAAPFAAAMTGASGGAATTPLASAGSAGSAPFFGGAAAPAPPYAGGAYPGYAGGYTGAPPGGYWPPQGPYAPQPTGAGWPGAGGPYAPQPTGAGWHAAGPSYGAVAAPYAAGPTGASWGAGPTGGYGMAPMPPMPPPMPPMPGAAAFASLPPPGQEYAPDTLSDAELRPLADPSALVASLARASLAFAAGGGGPQSDERRGLLYEDGVVQVGAALRPAAAAAGPEASAAAPPCAFDLELFVGNKSPLPSRALTGLSAAVLPSAEASAAVALASPVPAAVAPGQQERLLLRATAPPLTALLRGSPPALPLLRLDYVCGGRQVALTIPLPVPLLRFVAPSPDAAGADAFFALWRAVAAGSPLKQQQMVVRPPGSPPLSREAAALLLARCGFAPPPPGGARLDASADNAAGAGRFAVRGGGGGGAQGAAVLLLARVEGDPRSRLQFRVTVCAASEGAPAGAELAAGLVGAVRAALADELGHAQG